MKNPVIKITLRFLIIMFCITLIITPNINGFKYKSNQIVEKEIIQSSGLLAYWSFDEGEGNIAYDNSGHNYDGIIHGASWTTGYSNNALDFDGLDDYVNLDIHSKDLGFNKTDDYKISVWMKSVSTESSIIYEISDQDDFVPDVFLEQNDDGTLELKVQSTESCIIKYRTDNSYNDGIWHFIECIYHGDSSNPIIDLYIDYQYIGNETDWLCPMSSHQFKKAKIGVKSYDEAKYFDGILDEIKIHKKPDGNLPPNNPIISGPESGTVGEEYNYTFTLSDPDGEDLFLFVDWGDETSTGWIGPFTSNEEVTISHKWLENNSYVIKTRVRDTFDVSSWTNYLIAMGNVKPDKPSISGSIFCKNNQPYDFSFISTDLNNHDIRYFVDWGDRTSDWSEFSPSGEEISLSHEWAEQGIYFIQSKAEDIYGGESDLSDPFELKVTQKAFLFGLISDKESGYEYTKFNAKMVLYIGFSPFKIDLLNSNDQITIMNKHTSIINDLFVYGNFDALVV